MAAFQLSPDKSDVYGLSPQAPPATLHCESHPSSSTDSCENPASGDVIEAIFGTAKPATGTPKLDSRTLKLDPAKPKSASNFDLLAIKSASKSASNFDPAASKSLKFDLRAIKSESKLSEIIAKFIPIQKNGAEFSAICPFHADKKPSLSINDEKGVYLCRACGAAGDVISFVMDYSQIGFEQACEYLGGRKDPIVGNPGLQEKRAVPSPYDTLKVVNLPAAATLATPKPGERLRNLNTKAKKWVTYQPTMIFPYHALSGERIGIVARLDFNGAKTYHPMQVIEADEGLAWGQKPFTAPRPLYNLPALSRGAKQVIITEGEKDCDAVNRILSGAIPALTWCGGAGNQGHTDWSPLAGLRVVVWLDADKAGEDATLGTAKKPGVAELCHRAGASEVKIIPWDKTLKKGYGGADFEGDRAALLAWLKGRAVLWEPPMDAPYEDAPYEDAPHEDAPYEDYDRGDDTKGLPFTILGFNDGVYYYFPKDSQQLVKLTSNNHTEANLNQIAPLAYWEAQFPKDKGGSVFNVSAARNALLARSHAVGIFDVSRLRGRGAWMDEERVIVHCGDRLYVDGAVMKPAAIKSRYIYQARHALNMTVSNPATNEEANLLPQLCGRLTWKSSISGFLLAGWCVIAPVCGVLPWRPNIWLSGGTGVGKTTVLNKIVKPMIGFFAEVAEGGTTEPGLRRSLGIDARPIILDEFESEDKKAAETTRAVMGLLRIAASGGTKKMANREGGTDEFTIRTMALLSSLLWGASEGADIRRSSNLILIKNTAPDSKEQYKKLKSDLAATITPEYAERMFARTICNARTLLKNVQTFSDAVAIVMDNTTSGDQMGPMLAGLYLCYSTKEATLDEAVAWIKRQNWDEFSPATSGQDEGRLLSKILSATRVIFDGTNKNYSVGDMILRLCEIRFSEDTVAKDIRRELGRIGIKVLLSFDADMTVQLTEDYFLVANQTPDLEKILEGTPWSKNWNAVLQRIGGDGCESVGTAYFAPGLRRRAVRLPVSILGDNVP